MENKTENLEAHALKVEHNGHIDYLEDGELIHVEGSKTALHQIDVSSKNPAVCTADHPATGHDKDHVHGPQCGHPSVPHGDHTDYIVDGKLHHFHGDHCDNHGDIALIQ